MELNQLLADYRGEAAVLRKNGHKDQAESIERVCDAVAEATESYRRFLGEADALLYSGKAKKTLRRLYPELAAQGNAHQDAKGRRYYREMCLPRRVSDDALLDDAQRAARKDAAA
jgi:hypothetical protein